MYFCILILNILNLRSHQEIQARFEGQSSKETSGDMNESRIIDERQEELIRIQDRSIATGKTHATLRFVELKSKEIFWMTLYTLVLLAIFAERAYCEFLSFIFICLFIKWIRSE